MTLSEAFELYRVEVIAFRNQSRKTEEAHGCALKSFVKFMGDIPLESLDFELIRKWTAHMDNKVCSLTIRGYMIKLRVVLSHLRMKGIPCLDPELIHLPKRTDSVPNFLSKEQVAQLIDSTKCIRAKAIISILYASGLRVSELCSLDRSDIHDDCFTVVGKGSKARLCFMDERSKFYLNMYLESRKDSNKALFISRQNKLRITSSNVQEIFRHLCRKLKLKDTISAHWLRHSYATNLMQNGCHIYTVSRLMGHSSIQTTANYLHVSDPKLREEYQRHHTV